jgi:glycosyltransferase involved in cell wall biosynthesis
VSGLRVAHVQPMTLDLFGHDDADFGTSVRYSLANLALAQAELGMRPTVHLLASGRPHGGPRELEVGGMRVRFHPCVQPPRRTGQRVRFARQLSWSVVRALRRGETDLVHFHGVRQFHAMYGAVAWRARQQGLRLFAQDRGSRDVGRVEGAAQRYGLARTEQVLAASTDSADVLRGMGVPEAALHVVPNGVDPELFRPDPGHRPGGPDTPVRVVTVSRLSPEKDPLTMVDALVELQGRGRKVELVAISPGPLRAEVERRARAGGVPATFIDHVPQTELAERYWAADVLILTSLREGWNQVMLEAMASGLPVVATDIPGLRDAAGGAALLVPPGDPAAVADAVQKLTGDPELWQRQRERGLARTSDLTWNAIARRLADLYERVPARDR